MHFCVVPANEAMDALLLCSPCLVCLRQEGRSIFNLGPQLRGRNNWFYQLTKSRPQNSLQVGLGQDPALSLSPNSLGLCLSFRTDSSSAILRNFYRSWIFLCLDIPCKTNKSWYKTIFNHELHQVPLSKASSVVLSCIVGLQCSNLPLT